MSLKNITAKIVIFILKIFGGILVLLGTLSVPISFVILYMLISGQLQPGDNYYMGDSAPSISEAILSVVYSFLLILTGWVFYKLLPNAIDRLVIKENNKIPIKF